MLRVDEYFVLFASGLAIFIGASVFLRSLNLRSVLFALFLFFSAYLQMISAFITSRVMYDVPQLLFTQVPLGFSLSPLLYHYMTTFTSSKKKFRRIDYLHFIPAFILFCIAIWIYHLPIEYRLTQLEKVYDGTSDFVLFAGISMILFMIYIVIGILNIRKYYHKENPLHRRLLLVLVLFSSWFVLISVKIISMYFGHLELWRWVNVIFAIDIALLYFIIQRYPFLLSYASFAEGTEKKSISKVLSTIDIDTLSNEIDIMMEEEKLYCDEDLTLSRLAHALNVTPHQLSAFLNEKYNKNFNAFVNHHRIEYALSLLKSNPAASTLSVAFASGFNSYSTFYSAFKKITGYSPGEFKNRKLN